MLQPKRTKFRKQHKGRNRGVALKGAVPAGSAAFHALNRDPASARIHISAASNLGSGHFR